MNAEGSAPAAVAVRHWLRNLAQGLRLAVFLKPGPLSFRIGANHFIAIAATSLAVSLVGSFVLAGGGGTFDLRALPSALFWIVLTLAAGYLSGRVMQDRRYFMLIPIAMGSLGIVFGVASTLIGFAAGKEWLPLRAASDAEWLSRILYAWWALSALVGMRRLGAPLPARPVSPAAIVAMLVLLPAYFLPAEPLWLPASDGAAYGGAQAGARRTFSEQALYAQDALLRNAMAELKRGRAGVDDLYFVGFAPYAAQDVFMKETLAISKLLDQRFDTRGRSIRLVSHPGLTESFPVATLTSLRKALRAVGQRMDADEDLVLLHLTSHGSETHELSVEFAPLAFDPVKPQDVRAALDAAGIKWRIVVVSACYSGGFIDALKHSHALVVTASDATHTSFGCGDAYDFTYFSKAYYDEALRRTRSFENAFTMAVDAIRRRERSEGLEPSNPQIFVGAAMREKLMKLEHRLSAQAK